MGFNTELNIKNETHGILLIKFLPSTKLLLQLTNLSLPVPESFNFQQLQGPRYLVIKTTSCTETITSHDFWPILTTLAIELVVAAAAGVVDLAASYAD